MNFSSAGRSSAGRLFCLLLSLFFWLIPVPEAAAQQSPPRHGQIIREARCKVLIRAGISAKSGDVLPVSRQPASGAPDAVAGQVRIIKIHGNRLIGRVIEPRSDCRRLLGGYVLAGGTSAGGSLGSDNSGRSSVKGPPPPLRMLVSAGTGIVSSTLKGISRATVVETYPLVLSSAQASFEVFPLSFAGTQAEARRSDYYGNIFGLEGTFRFIAALNDVRVTIPSAATGEEIDLDLRLNRMVGRGGVLLRYPLWKGRLFLDARGGYTFNKLVSGISKLVNAPSSDKDILELSPLRDLSLGGFYSLAGFQFQPVDKFRARLNAGTLLGVNYQLDNRLPDAALSAKPVAASIKQPSLFLLEASFNYLFSRLQIGIDLSVESLSGRALFPDGRNEGSIAEIYTSYGLNLAFLL